MPNFSRFETHKDVTFDGPSIYQERTEFTVSESADALDTVVRCIYEIKTTIKISN